MNSAERKRIVKSITESGQDPEIAAAIRKRFCTPTSEKKAGLTRGLQTIEDGLHVLRIWSRGVGASSLLLGIGCALFTDWFWIAVILGYLGLAVVLIDVLMDAELRQHGWPWFGAVGFVIAIAVIFSLAFVFVSAPLVTNSVQINAEQPVGEGPGGLTWRPEFTEVDVFIENPTDIVYEDLNLVIRPDTPVAAIGQLSHFDGVSFEDKDGVAMRLADYNPASRRAVVIHQDLLATDAGYRVRCVRLPKGTLRIVIALAEIKWGAHPRLSYDPATEARIDPNFVMKMRGEDFSSYWYGNRAGDVYNERPTSSGWVRIDGDYIARHRKRHFAKKIQIGVN